MESKRKALIIGSGLAGLSSAIRLRLNGYEVEVFEANPYPGGKLSEMHVGNYRFDAGPSLFTMPHFVDELFHLAGKNPRDYYKYKQKEVVCNYFFNDGKRFTAYSDSEKYAKHASETFDVDKKAIQRYFKNARKKYDLTAPLFLENSLHELGNYLNFKTIKAIAQLHHLSVFSSLDEHNQKYFKDKNLQQLFNRYATYNGSSPYMTPGIMSMIPHLEQHFGTFVPEGGMISITNALWKLADELGVQFHFGKRVEKIIIEHSAACGLMVDGERYNGDLVVSNMDVVPTYRKLLKEQIAPDKTLKQERSSSALIFYWGIKKNFPELDLHNILFSEDYENEFNDIFKLKTIPSDPTVYINISAKDELKDAPEGCENWFVMINVPGNTGQNWDKLIPLARKRIIERINKALNTDIETFIEAEDVLEPRTIESRTQSYQGSLYGAASNNRFAAFLRHPNFSQSLKNLYFCGGSVHPGGGIPLALLSGKITANIIQKQGVK
jgi:diapolycopene oxygenase